MQSRQARPRKVECSYTPEQEAEIDRALSSRLDQVFLFTISRRKGYPPGSPAWDLIDAGIDPRDPPKPLPVYREHSEWLADCDRRWAELFPDGDPDPPLSQKERLRIVEIERQANRKWRDTRGEFDQRCRDALTELRGPLPREDS